MDNTTATACDQCHAIIIYDKDGIEPILCPVCARKNKEAEAEYDYADEDPQK